MNEVAIRTTPTRRLARDGAVAALAINEPPMIVYLVSMACSTVLFVTTGASAGISTLALFTMLYAAFIGLSAAISVAGGRTREERAHAKRLEVACSLIAPRLLDLLPKSDWREGKDGVVYNEGIRLVHAMEKDEGARATLERLAIPLEDLHVSWKAAKERLGEVEDDIQETFQAEAGRAAKALVQAAQAEHEAGAEARRRAARERAPDIVRDLSERARAISGSAGGPLALPGPSASATLGRLTAIAEKALATDPDLVDAADARIDDLVRRHLPRLRDAHVHAATTADLAALPAVDDKFAQGVDAVRASIQEALTRDATRRFDALRDEVAFLEARRQG